MADFEFSSPDSTLQTLSNHVYRLVGCLGKKNQIQIFQYPACKVHRKEMMDDRARGSSFSAFWNWHSPHVGWRPAMGPASCVHMNHCGKILQLRTPNAMCKPFQCLLVDLPLQGLPHGTQKLSSELAGRPPTSLT